MILSLVLNYTLIVAIDWIDQIFHFKFRCDI